MSNASLPALTGVETIVEYVSIRKTVERTAPVLSSLSRVGDLALELGIHDLVSEALWVVTIDGARGVHGVYQVARGGYHDADVSLPVLLGTVLSSGTDRFLMVHNHPSGEARPTDHDLELTDRVMNASAILDLMFEDHVVVTPQGAWSSAKRRRMG